MAIGLEKQCKCQSCGKRFDYMDEQSPMLKEEIWNQVVRFYNLEKYEKEANDRFHKNYEYRKLIGKRHSDDEHLYFCYECMEKALGRKLVREDLINKDVPLNVKFEKMYFKD